MINFFRNYRTGNSYWEDGSVTKKIGTISYIIKGKRFDHKSHVQQIGSIYIENIEKKNDVGLPMEVFNDVSRLHLPLTKKNS